MITSAFEHQSQCHNFSLEFVCRQLFTDENKVCEFRAASADVLNKHKEIYHGCEKEKGPLLQCPKCPQMLTHRCIAKHEREHHDPNLPFSCDQCSYRALFLHSIKYENYSTLPRDCPNHKIFIKDDAKLREQRFWQCQ